MTNNFTLKKSTFFRVRKPVALALFFYLLTLFTLPAQAQAPVVTNSATYDVFMNLDPTQGIDPTNFATDVSGYLDVMGAASGSYRLNTSAVTLDPTDVAKWDVYDHYDTQWYANQAAWSASPGGFNNGNIPGNWYYYGVSDAYGGLNSKITIKELLDGNGTWGQTGRLQSHIYPYVENGKPSMQFYGYSAIGAADFLYYPADVASTKTVKFDVDAQLISTHTLIAAGFLINGGTSGTGASKTISGHLLLMNASLTSVNIYKLNNVNVDALHLSGAGALGTLVATYNSPLPSKSHIELNITSTSVTATIQQLDGSGNLTGSPSTMFNSQTLTNTGFGGFGPFVLYSGHGCTSGTAFRYSNIEMAFGGVLSGNSSLESYQYAEYLDNSTNRFFVNLTNTSATNYESSSNDVDNAYLTRMKEDGAILITDESTGTYLPGTLNENIKNTMDEPTDAIVAAALSLSDLSGLTSAQQLAAKVAYLILNTTLGAYGTIEVPVTTAVASLYLMDGPGTDEVWTGANQVNEIRSWLVSGTSIDIYLNPDNSVNATVPTVLTPTYTLTDPSGTKTTITTSVDGNGKLYCTFPKTSAVGEYSVTLSYATGGSITSTVPSSATFDYLPVPPLDGMPDISGTMKYGQILTVTPNITNNTGTLSFQWKANGINISGATGNTYTLTANEVGKPISCDITSDVESGTLNATASGTVAKITLTATVSAVNSKTYDGTTATTGGTISFSGMVNSENLTYNSTIVWTSVNVGTGTINVSGVNLTSLTDRYDLSVTSLSDVIPGNNATISTKATPTVSVYPTADAITYGQTLENSTLTTSSAVVNGVGGSITGGYVWKTSATQPTLAGTFTTATVTFTPDNTTNYNSIDFNISVTVSKAMLTVTAYAQTKVYGEANPSLTFEYSGWQNTDGVADLTTAPTANTLLDETTGVGIHTDAITVDGGVDENYDFTYEFADLTITKAMLTVTAEAKTKVYGEANPSLTFQYSGWQNLDDATDLSSVPTASTILDETTGAGLHTDAITVAGGVDENYDFDYEFAGLTITKAILTVTANAQSKVYGEANPSLIFHYNGWVKGVETIDTPPAISTTVTSTTEVGTYTGIITLSGGSDNNYSFSFVSGGFEVTKAMLTVEADSQTKVYGSANPTLTFSYSGWKNTDSEATLDTKPTSETTVDVLTSVGTYTNVITVSGGLDRNYNFTYVPADFEVTKALLTIGAEAQNKVYDGTNNATVTGELVGVLNGDIVSLSLGSAYFENKNAGNDKGVTVTGSSISGAGTENYTLKEVSGLKADITPKQLTITNTSVVTNKMFDNATTAIVENAGVLQGLETADASSVDVSAIANYDDAAVGKDIVITTVFTISGSAASNYIKPSDLIITNAKISDKVSLSEALEVPVMGECQGEDLFIGYQILKGTPTDYQITYDAAALAAGFINTGYLPLPSSLNQDKLYIPVPANMVEGVYTANLQFRNELNNESPVYHLEFTIKLSKNYIVKKFDDVILCDNSSNQFTEYQWYKDGQPIPGATGQFYNELSGLDGVYSIQVGTKEGAILFSCEQEYHTPKNKNATISAYPNPARSSEPFTVKVTNLNDQDLRGAVMRIYNLQGSLVQTINEVRQVNSVKLPFGEYIGTVITSDQKRFTYKITIINF